MLATLAAILPEAAPLPAPESIPLFSIHRPMFSALTGALEDVGLKSAEQVDQHLIDQPTPPDRWCSPDRGGWPASPAGEGAEEFAKRAPNDLMPAVADMSAQDAKPYRDAKPIGECVSRCSRRRTCQS